MKLKWRFPVAARSLAIPALMLAMASQSALAQNASPALDAEKKRLQAELEIEKLKADIADNRRKQLEAEKAEAAAKVPATEAKALPGSLDLKNFGAAGLVVAVDLAREMAVDVCAALPGSKPVAVYDPTMASGIVSARLLQAQMDLFRKSLNQALAQQKPSDVYKTFSGGVGLDTAVVTGTVKAFADLAALFKTNVTVAKTDFTDAKMVFVTALAEKCGSRIVSAGSGYLGELDEGPIKALQKDGLDLLGDRAILEDRITTLRSNIEGEKDAGRKKQLQAQLDKLTPVAKQVDGFLAIIKPSEVNDKSPLPTAARYLALAKRIANADVLDLDIKLEGLSIVKENLFTGQRLKLSGTAILWYRVHDLGGGLLKAGVLRRMAKPIHVDLRGDDPKDEFWSQK